jgi:1-acyl-sn-glycerol-3-phosphate acyltransferase
MGTISLIVSRWDTNGNRQWKIARVWARMLLAIAGARIRVVGLEKIDPRQCYVIVSNHLSYFDTPALTYHLPLNFRFLAKKELFSIPFLGGHLKSAGHICVPLEDPRAALKVLSHAGTALKEKGLSLLVFPEGGRSETGELQPYMEGAAYLAIKGGVPILPVCLIGIRDVLPMHSSHLKPADVTIRIADPIDVSGMRVGDRAELTERLRNQNLEMQQLGK